MASEVKTNNRAVLGFDEKTLTDSIRERWSHRDVADITRKALAIYRRPDVIAYMKKWRQKRGYTEQLKHNDPEHTSIEDEMNAVARKGIKQKADAQSLLNHLVNQDPDYQAARLAAYRRAYSSVPSSVHLNPMDRATVLSFTLDDLLIQSNTAARDSDDDEDVDDVDE